MWFLSQSIVQLGSRLPTSFTSGAGFERIVSTAARLPAALTHCTYFELWPPDGRARADLIVRIDQQGRAMLADPVGTLSDALVVQPAWRALARFARAWSVPDSVLARFVDGMWIEFDLEPRSKTPWLTPRVFVDFTRATHAALSVPERHDLICLAVRLLAQGELDPAIARRVRDCFDALDAGAVLPYIGLAPGLPSRSLRVCIMMPPAHVTAYLTRLGWPGDCGVLRAEILEPAREHMGAAAARGCVLHLDLAPDVSPRIGLELAFHRPSQHEGVVLETPLIEWLIARGWCGADLGAMMRTWPGRTIEPLPHEIWLSRVSRRISHVKLTYETARPVGLKAYFCFFDRLWAGGTMLGGRPYAIEPEAASSRAPLRFGGSGPRLDAPAASSIAPEIPRRREITRRVFAGRDLAYWMRPGGRLMHMSMKEQRALDAVLRRSAVDAEFRHSLLTDPRRAIREAYGVRIPPDFRVKFIERDADIDALIVLPDFRPAAGEPLDEGADVVAGGGGDEPYWGDGVDN